MLSHSKNLRSSCDGKSCSMSGSLDHKHHHHVKKNISHQSFADSQSYKNDLIQKSIIQNQQNTSSESIKQLENSKNSSHHLTNSKQHGFQQLSRSKRSSKKSVSSNRHLAISSDSSQSIVPSVKTETDSKDVDVYLSVSRKFMTDASFVYNIAKKYLTGWFNENKPKTDYTYSRSASYLSSSDSEYDTPNMSRRSLRNSSKQFLAAQKNAFDATINTEYSSYKKFDLQHTHYSGSDESIPSPFINSPSSDYYSKTDSQRLDEYANYTNHYIEDYGLDYTSDVSDREEDNELLVNNFSSHHNSYSKTVKTMTIFEWLLIGTKDTLAHYFRNFWYLIYRLSTSLLLLDFWILSRSRISSKLYCLPFLLPLLLFLGLIGLYYLRDKSSEEISMPWIFPFLQSSKKEIKSHEEHIVSIKNDVGRSSLTEEIRQFIITMHKQNYDLIKEKQLTETDVKYITNQEILLLYKQQQEAQQENLIKQKNLEKELNTMQQSMSILTSETESALHIKHLEDMIEHLKEDVRKLQESKDEMMIDIKRCCKNEADFYTNIYKYINESIIKMGNDNKGIIDFELSQMNKRIESHFAAGNLFDSKLDELINSFNAKMVAVEKKSNLQSQLIEKEFIMRTSNSVSSNISFEEKRVHEIINAALKKYNADKIGMADFALESSGGSVISTKCSETFSLRPALVSWYGIPIWQKNNSPRSVIQPDINPGQCWAFKGSQGYVVIQLSGVIIPTGFTLEHIPKSLSFTGNINSAPKNFTVLGLHNESVTEGVVLGSYIYDDNGDPLQYFPVENTNAGAFPIVELRVHSNHGNPEYTCLYRFRVHGVLQ